MRLRSLRKLEEFEIRGEHKELSKEQKELKALLKSDEQKWTRISDEIKDIKAALRREELRWASVVRNLPRLRSRKVIDIEAFVEKEPITILYSKMGWLRALKGHEQDTGPRLNTKKAMRRRSFSKDRRRTSCCYSPPTDASTPCPATKSRAAKLFRRAGAFDA